MLPLPDAYRIVEVRRHAVFAGKLGQRVSEDVLLEGGNGRILVHLAGSYHTLCVPETSRLHVGDTVTIRGALDETEPTVARDRIRRVTP